MQARGRAVFSQGWLGVSGLWKLFGIAFATGIVSGAAAVLGAYFWLKLSYGAPGPFTDETVFVVPRGAGAIRIANRLEADGLISNARVFRVAIRLRGVQRELKAGEYAIPAAASMADIVALLRAGDVVEHRTTIIEGMTSAQIVRALNANEILSGDAIVDIPGEGTLLPDTYAITRDMTRQDVLDRMAEAQANLLDQLWPDRADDLPFETPEQAVILASIVEREAGGFEHDLVAGALVNRLRCPRGPSCEGRGWRLEADATVHYGVNGGEPLFNKQGQRRTLYRSELRNRDNAYNTYQHDGLTPGPISNPGRAAIAAVLNPASTDAMYFVADGTGGHAFAATLDEHNANVARWRAIERQRIDAERAGGG